MATSVRWRDEMEDGGSLEETTIFLMDEDEEMKREMKRLDAADTSNLTTWAQRAAVQHDDHVRSGSPSSDHRTLMSASTVPLSSPYATRRAVPSISDNILESDNEHSSPYGSPRLLHALSSSLSNVSPQVCRKNLPCNNLSPLVSRRTPSPNSLSPLISKNSVSPYSSLNTSPSSSPCASPSVSPGVSPSASPQNSPSLSPGLTPECGTRPKVKVIDAVKSLREQAEIEAAEASQWLKAAGFPQYAQMYEDCLFPIDIHSVETDHDFLDRDSIHSLFRRLNTLNKCASMKIETIPKKTGDESDDDDQCALSRKWKFQRSSRRWSRRLNPLEVFILENYTKSDILDGCDQLHLQECEKALSLDSNRSMLTDKYANSSSIDSPATRQKSYRIPNPEIDTMKHKKSTKKQPTMGDVTTPREAIIEISSPILVQKLTHRDLAMNTHERMKGAKSLLKRLDSLKGRKSSSLKKRPALNLKGGINISQPILTANSNVQDKIELYNCVDLNPRKDDVVPRDKSMTSPSVTRRVKTDHNAADRSKRGGVVFSNNESLNIADVCEKMDTKESPKIPPKCSPASGNRRNTEISYSNDNVFSAFDDQECGTFPRLLSNGYIETGTGSRINTRTGSFNFGSDSCHDNTFFPRPRRRRRNSEDDSALRSSVYDNVAFHGSLDSMAYTDIGLDEIEEQLRQEINNLSNLDNCNSTSMPAMTEHVPELQKYGLSRNTSIASMSSNDLETEKQDILNNISQLLMTDYLQDEPSNNNSQDKSDTVSMKSYDTWHDEEVTEDISAISAEVEAILNGINENLCQLTEINMDETYIGDDSSVTSPIPSPTPDTTPEIPSKKIHLQIDTDAGISGNSSCQDTSEIDTAGSMEDLTGVMEVHERRDSGVGSSLSRSVRRPRIRWHSFSKSHRPSLNSRPFQIHNLSAGQIMVLRKLSLLKLTAMMERYSISNRSWSGWIKVMPRFMRRMKAPDYKDRAVFGVPLSVTLQRTGQPLPQTILHAMRYLRKTAPDALGIFRKPGVRTRIQQLRNVSESNPDEVDYEGVMAYDVADMLKQYFRELPEPLLTSKLSETFITIHTAMPKDIRLQAMQASIMLMPDENIEVLQSLLLFLSDIAEHSDTNQMTAHNLAVCFAPSLFHMSGPRSGSSPQRRRRANLGKPDQKELSDNIAAHECLATMIKEVKKLFVIPEETMMKCHFSYMELGEPVSVNELGSKKEDDNNADYKSYIESCVQGLLKEAREKFKGWVSCPPMENGTELAYKKVGDGHPLRLWKCTVEVEAPPTELLHRILRERHLWDDDFVKWRIVEKLDQQTEVLQYVSNSMAPHPSRDYCTLRSWRADLPRGACVLVSTSVEHPDASLIGGIRGTILASRFLIEPCGAGKSRLTHICRLDTRGRSVEWYNKVFGHMRANLIGKLRDSFKHNSTDGPETKV